MKKMNKILLRTSLITASVIAAGGIIAGIVVAIKMANNNHKIDSDKVEKPNPPEPTIDISNESEYFDNLTFPIFNDNTFLIESYKNQFIAANEILQNNNFNYTWNINTDTFDIIAKDETNFTGTYEINNMSEKFQSKQVNTQNTKIRNYNYYISNDTINSNELSDYNFTTLYTFIKNNTIGLEDFDIFVYDIENNFFDDNRLSEMLKIFNLNGKNYIYYSLVNNYYSQYLFEIIC